MQATFWEWFLTQIKEQWLVMVLIATIIFLIWRDRKKSAKAKPIDYKTFQVGNYWISKSIYKISLEKCEELGISLAKAPQYATHGFFYLREIGKTEALTGLPDHAGFVRYVIDRMCSEDRIGDAKWYVLYPERVELVVD